MTSAVLDTAAVLIVVLSRDGRIARFNRACETATGYSSEEVCGRILWEFLIPTEEAAEVRAVFAALKAGNFPNRHENDWVSKDGARRRLVWSNTALLDDQGVVEFVIGTGVDVTDQRRVEHDLRDARDRLELRVLERTAELAGTVGRLTAEIQERRKAEQQLREAKERSEQDEAVAARLRDELARVGRVNAMGELAAALAHELNQPLAASLADTETARLLLAAPTPDLAGVRMTLADIAAAQRLAGEIVRRVRSQMRPGMTKFRNLDLNVITRESVRLVHNRSVLESVAVHLTLHAKLPLVMGNRVEIIQVLTNLMVNAMDAMRDTPVAQRALRVSSLLLPDGMPAVEVADAGTGVAPERLEAIFEAFHTTKVQGMGMGLTIGRSIAAAHGGRLDVRNNSGRGATFTLALPACRKE